MLRSSNVEYWGGQGQELLLEVRIRREEMKVVVQWFDCRCVWRCGMSGCVFEWVTAYVTRCHAALLDPEDEGIKAVSKVPEDLVLINTSVRTFVSGTEGNNEMQQTKERFQEPKCETRTRSNARHLSVIIPWQCFVVVVGITWHWVHADCAVRRCLTNATQRY